jgi:putative DNA primase/helicase
LSHDSPPLESAIGGDTVWFVKADGTKLGPYDWSYVTAPHFIDEFAQRFHIDPLIVSQEVNHLLTYRNGELTTSTSESESISDAYPPQSAYFDGKKFIPKYLADAIMQRFHFVTMRDNEDIYVYSDGYYQSHAETFIKEQCKAALCERYRHYRATGVIDFIKVSTYIVRREEPPHLIPLNNGVLDLSSLLLHPHSPHHLFFNKIPVNFDPKAECPNIQQFHHEITGDPSDIAVLEEVLGFCLYRQYFIAKALMLVGGGANGKSTWLSLAKTFLGLRNVSGRSLQDLEEHRFAKADLHTKLANIFADLSDKALSRTGTFKMLTGRDLMTAERKFRDPFEYENYAKLLFSANKVPEVRDDTSAFFRRWLIIVFPNTFTGNDADPHILDKCTTDEELSGLLNRAIAGLHRLLATGQFSHSKTTEEVREDYIRKSSPIAAFVMDEIEADSDAFIVKKELYNVFATFCRQHALPAVTEATFFKNLPQHVPLNNFRPTIQHQRAYCVRGIRYRPIPSKASTVSKVFYSLVSRKTDYQDEYHVALVSESDFIKVHVPPDILDTVDATGLDVDLGRGGEKYTTIERVEAYVKRHQSVGCMRASQELDIPLPTFQRIVASSDKLVYGPEQQTVQWKTWMTAGSTDVRIDSKILAHT